MRIHALIITNLIKKKLRISLDFRIILYDDYIKYLNSENLKKLTREIYKENESQL